MLSYFPFVCVILALPMGYGSRVFNAQIVNDRPIIGVLSQELTQSLEGIWGQNYSSFIAASYVKFIEGAGARVVPIMINQNQTYYEDIINSVNGILIPGGANFYNESGYGQAGGILYDLAVSLNQQGDYFPVWGTCLGFELLIYLMADRDDPREVCDAWDRADPLNFETDFRQSSMFAQTPEKIVNTLASQSVTSNFHRWCITKQGLASAGLDSSLQVLATSTDNNDLRYIAAFESRTMPIYGVQFHPEKPLYEWNTKEKSIPHSAAAVRSSAYFADFFVNEARKNSHTFATAEIEKQHLIYNYAPTFTGAENKIYDQCYFFV